jgi:anti-sigma B factor antagonist
MKIKEKVEQNIAVLSISGNMMGGSDTDVLHDKVRSLIDDGITKIVIDLKGVKWMNSSGLGALMACYGSITKIKGRLKLANVAEKVKSIFMITQIVKFFDTYETVDRAIASFQEEEKQSK